MVKRTKTLYDKFYKESARHLEITNPILWALTLTAKELGIPLEKAASDTGIALTGYNKPVSAKTTAKQKRKTMAQKKTAPIGKTYVSPRTGKQVWTNDSHAVNDTSEAVWKRDFATQKQRSFIATMRQVTNNAIPTFDGTTKGEAYEFIDKHRPTLLKYQLEKAKAAMR